MTDEKILSELRTIRTLLALDKEERLNERLNGHSDIQEQVLDQLSDENWAQLPTADLADEHDVSKKTIQNHVGDLIDDGLIERKGQGGGIEYRKTGLLSAAELVADY
ncbi:hypothetical protein GCM10028857_01340 [Salinarchaeum chitinilyticum]